jgi:hypothetical protein
MNITITTCGPVKIGKAHAVVGYSNDLRETTFGVSSMPATVRTILMLTLSNVFMTFAWYAHLKNLLSRPWYVAALVSWGIALFEYLLQVPANRIGPIRIE